MTNRHVNWLQKVARGDSPNAVAQHAGITQSTLSRQIHANEISMPNVVAIARAYGVSPVQALVDTGYLEEFEVASIQTLPELGLATNQELLKEIGKRTDPEATRLFRTVHAPPAGARRAKVVQHPDRFTVPLVDIYATDEDAEPAKVEPAKVEPVKGEPVKDEPAPARQPFNIHNITPEDIAEGVAFRGEREPGPGDEGYSDF